MEIVKKEITKLFNYIVENHNIKVNENEPFIKNILIRMQEINENNTNTKFEITPIQEKIIIDSFLKSNLSFNNNMANIILTNRDCILNAIEQDINSIDYIKEVDDELRNIIINEVLKQSYVLKPNSPSFLKENYAVIQRSITIDPLSANEIIWFKFNEEQEDILIDEIIKSDYILTKNSSPYLKSNQKIVLTSIKKDIKTIKYADSSLKMNKEIFKYLLLNNYEFSEDELRDVKLLYLQDIDIMDYFFRDYGYYNSVIEITEFNKRLINIYHKILNNVPKIGDFKEIFQMIVEEEWEKYRNQNSKLYKNVFGKITSELQNISTFNDVFNDVLESLDLEILLINMEQTLGNEYSLLQDAMKEYFQIYHSDTENKLESIQSSKDTIANLSAVYVSKSKDKYINDLLTHYYNLLIKPLYILKVDHPIVKKRIIEVKQREKFKKLYFAKNEEVISFLETLSEKYNYIRKESFMSMCSDIITDRSPKFTNLFPTPSKYYEYLRFQKASKLITRLNQGFIKIDGVEVQNYKDIIGYDALTKQYIYTGLKFKEYQISSFKLYQNKEQQFNKVIKDIMQKIKQTDVEDDIDYRLLDELGSTLPFNDEYFIFDIKAFLHNLNFNDFMSCAIRNYIEKSFINDESYKIIENIFINNALIILLLIFKSYNGNISSLFDENGINIDNIDDLIMNMPTIISTAKDFKIDINKFRDLIDISKIIECASPFDIAVLDQDIIIKLYKNTDFTSRIKEKIIKNSSELICGMIKRNKSTVPYINGETTNYKYSMYDSLDEEILLAGINTDSCFKINGNDNDFLHYCALDKNGFVIKITDHYGNFIAKASGFRNGNCVFINQLRTIYDISGNIYEDVSDNECTEIINTFEKACEDIVKTSQNNDLEKDKIDFVFVTQSYSLNLLFSNVSGEVTEEIGDEPMDNKSDDWNTFINSTHNLREANTTCNYFSTDYGSYPLICMVSSKEISEITPNDIKPHDVEALYKRERGKIIITNKIDATIDRKINKIKAIQLYQNNQQENFEKLNIPNNSIMFVGDDWYIILHNYEIFNCCLLQSDERATMEFKATIKTIKEIIHNKSKLNIEQITTDINKECNYKDKVKVLKIN